MYTTHPPTFTFLLSSPHRLLCRSGREGIGRESETCYVEARERAKVVTVTDRHDVQLRGIIALPFLN